jgi:hypothetical protein
MFGRECPIKGRNGHSPRRTGWVIGLREYSPTLDLVAITFGAWRNNPDWERWKGQLRGKRIRLARMEKNANAPVMVTFLGATERPLPQAPDIPDLLCRMYGVEGEVPEEL